MGLQGRGFLGWPSVHPREAEAIVDSLLAFCRDHFWDEAVGEIEYRAEQKRLAKERAEEEARQRGREREIENDAFRCWRDRREPPNDDVRAAMVALQQNKRERIREDARARGYGDGYDRARLLMASDGYGYDDGHFFVTETERWDAKHELSRREREAERRAILLDPAFDEDDADAPLFDYFDPGETELLPRYPRPGVLYFFGPRQSYKTTLLVWCLCAAIAKDPNLRVLFFEGELAASVRKMRLAYGTEHGLTADEVKARFYVRDGVPALGKPENAEMVVDLADKLGVGIVVFDTWARAIIGMREIDDAVMALIGEDGPIGRLLAYDITVVCTGHTPVGDPHRLRGHSGPSDAAYENVSVIKTKTNFRATVQTLRGGKPERLRTVTATVASGDVPILSDWSSKIAKPGGEKAIEQQQLAFPVVAPAVEEPVAETIASGRPMTRAEKNAEYQRQFKARKKAEAASKDASNDVSH
jgi:hypothetical protein